MESWKIRNGRTRKKEEIRELEREKLKRGKLEKKRRALFKKKLDKEKENKETSGCSKNIRNQYQLIESTKLFLL